jgi:hypothetical protein
MTEHNGEQRQNLRQKTDIYDVYHIPHRAPFQGWWHKLDLTLSHPTT